MFDLRYNEMKKEEQLVWQKANFEEHTWQVDPKSTKDGNIAVTIGDSQPKETKGKELSEREGDLTFISIEGKKKGTHKLRLVYAHP